MNSPARPTFQIAHAGLWLILSAYLAVGVQYAALTPAWQVPDEPAHYNYIRHLVERGAFPVLQTGDYDQAYLSRLTAERFPPELSIEPVRYEGHQPPLYYLLAAPLFALSNGSLLALRLLSVTLGVGVIVFTYLLARQAVPGRPALALGAAGFLAFVPQHVAMLAGVNNDALAEVWMSLGLWLALRQISLNVKGVALTFNIRLLGLVLGAAFLTKTTAYPLAAVAGLAVLLRWRRRPERLPLPAGEAPHLATGLPGPAGATGGLPLASPTQRVVERMLVLPRLELAILQALRPLLADLASLFIPALLLGALWWGRNLAVYGGMDFLGLQRHNSVVLGQPRTAEWLRDLGTVEYARRFLTTTFQSFWGQFGWMGVVMDQRIYRVLLAFSLALLVGLLGAAWWLRGRLTAARRGVLAVLSVGFLLGVAAYLYYNLTFVQFQGRYLFPVLPVISLGAAAALWQWGQWLRRLWPAAWLEHAPAAATLAGLAALDLFALYRFVLPALRLP